MSYRPLYRAVYARSLLFANEMVNLIAHYIGLSTYTAVNSKNVNIFLIAHYIGLSTKVSVNEEYYRFDTYRPLYRAVYKEEWCNGDLVLPLIAHYIGLSTTYLI